MGGERARYVRAYNSVFMCHNINYDKSIGVISPLRHLSRLAVFYVGGL